MRKLGKVAPVSPSELGMILDRVREEARSSYRVADKLEVDWCPCCGINIRFRDEDGKLIAKFIATPTIAKSIGLNVNLAASRAAEIAADPLLRQRAIDDLLMGAAASHRYRSGDA